MLHRCNRKQGNVKGQFVYYWAIIERNLVILGIMPKKSEATTSHKGETVFLFLFLPFSILDARFPPAVSRCDIVAITT